MRSPRQSSPVAGPARPTGRSRLPGWLGYVLQRLLDVGLGLLLYRVYAALRNAQGEDQPGAGSTVRARQHGVDVLSLERTLHLNVEHVAQNAVLAAPEWLIKAANVYYASVHLPLTAVVFCWLVLRRSHREFAPWRNTLVVGTALALAGFALFPTMPPRLISGSYLDTVAVYGGLWSSHAPVLEHIEHPYAAMPSLHIIWALWVGTAIARFGRWRWLRRLGPVHVVATSVFVVVTGNHWLLDVAAGAAVFAVATLAMTRPRRRDRSAPELPAAGHLVEAA